MKPRYILNNNKHPIKIFEDIDVKSASVRVYSNFDDPIYIDILTPMREGTCRNVKIRAYLKDGQFCVGYVAGFLIDIIHKDSLYDGRFNLISE